MKPEKLYAVAIFCLKPDPEHEVEQAPNGGIKTRYVSRGGEEVNYYTNFAGEAGVERALSEEMACEAAVRQAKEIYPESEGWTLHRAHAVEIEPGLILEAASVIAAEFEPQAPAEERAM